MKNTSSIGIFFLSLFLFSCSSVSSTQYGERTYSSVEDYLRTVSGIRVIGSGTNAKAILTTAGKTFNSSDYSTLYVIDGQQIGNSLRDADERINPNDIKRVKVWSVGDATIRFGINGAYGAIEFLMKK